MAANEAKLEIMESELEIKGLDTEELALFLACTMTQEECLTNIVHKRRNKKGPVQVSPAKPSQMAPKCEMKIGPGFHPAGSQDADS